MLLAKAKTLNLSKSGAITSLSKRYVDFFLADSDLETRKIMFLEFKVTIQEDWDIAKSEGK